ncbi:MAG: geranylgeranylglycerol-phosphate geranylgeranyltransferase [Bacteroidetes bacterium]|nr:geranylgeranylglycerol-phosphate geranylgeranyltransferase [Bacteroidota bacterium]
MNFKSIKAFFIIIRPINIVITFFVIATGIILSSENTIEWSKILIASLCGASVAAAGMIINDICDQAIDKINRPTRVLPSGMITEKKANIWFISLNIFALILVLNLPLHSQAIVFSAIFLIYFYSVNLKKTVLLGNITVAGSAGLAFIFSGSVVGNYDKIFLPAIFAFLINFAREVVKDLEDVEGDKKENAKTFPIVYGMRATQILATIILFLLFYSTLKLIKNESSIIYISFLIYLPVIVSIYFMWNSKIKNNLRITSLILKFTMIAGLVIIFML